MIIASNVAMRRRTYFHLHCSMRRRCGALHLAVNGTVRVGVLIGRQWRRTHAPRFERICLVRTAAEPADGEVFDALGRSAVRIGAEVAGGAVHVLLKVSASALSVAAMPTARSSVVAATPKACRSLAC